MKRLILILCLFLSGSVVKAQLSILANYSSTSNYMGYLLKPSINLELGKINYFESIIRSRIHLKLSHYQSRQEKFLIHAPWVKDYISPAYRRIGNHLGVIITGGADLSPWYSKGLIPYIGGDASFGFYFFEEEDFYFENQYQREMKFRYPPTLGITGRIGLEYLIDEVSLLFEFKNTLTLYGKGSFVMFDFGVGLIF
jgi:hypothetical protein